MKSRIRTIVITILLAAVTAVYADEPVSIAVIGTGDMGDSLGPRFAEAGYRVVYGSREPEADKVRSLVTKTGNGSFATSPNEAAAQADVIALALPWYAMEGVVKTLSGVDEKTVIDMSGVWRQGEDGYPERTVDTSAAEVIQQWLPTAKVVKTFATAGSHLIDDPLAAGGIVTMPIASDDKAAKEFVAQLVTQLGFDPVDFGPLRMSRHIESLQAVWLIPAFQRQSAGWEFHFRRAAWPCRWNFDAWSTPTSDAGQLAEFPDVVPALEKCAEQPVQVDR